MRRLLICLFVLMMALPALAQTDAEQACFERFGQWDAETETCNLNMSVEIRMAYPLEFAENQFVMNELDTFIEQLRVTFAESFAQYGFPSPGPWTLYVDYEVYTFSEDIFSINFNISEYTGGAHPNLYFETMTFDIASGALLAFEDLFGEESNPLQTIAPIVQEELGATLGTDESAMQWILSGTGEENFENYRDFVVAEEGLILFFEPYQVAAYAAGPQSVTIPWDTLNTILRPPFSGAQ